MREHGQSTANKKLILATVIGNGFVWFDFTCYGFLSIIVANLFSPTQDELTSLLFTMAIFGIAFIMRPVGGILLGMYSDRVGRKQALWVTMLLMAIGTGLLGLTPTYDQIGIWSPVLVVLARLLQGFSAGGATGIGSALLTQYTPAGKRGFYTSWMQASIYIGILPCAIAGVALTTYLSREELYSWGWRIPFLFGTLIGLLGLYVRSTIDNFDETVIEGDQQKRPTSPLLDTIQQYPREILVGFSLVVLWTICFHVLLFYIPVYAHTVLNLPSSNGFISVMLGGAIVLTFSPIFGALSDRFGRKIFLSVGAGTILILVYPMFYILTSFPSLTSLLLFQLFFALLIACYEGSILAAMTELFPQKILSTGISIAYNFAVAIFGGFAAMIITWLVATTENDLAPAYYVAAAAAISLTATLFIQNKPKPI